MELKDKIYYPEIRVFDKDIGWKHKPSTLFHLKGKEWDSRFKTNSLGFKDREHSIKKEKETYRVLFLGDSYTAAIRVPIEKSFSYLFEKISNSDKNITKKKGNIETINISVGGWSTVHELAALKKYGLKFKPDEVVLVFCIANDIIKNSYEDPSKGIEDTSSSFLLRVLYNITPKKMFSYFGKGIRTSNFLLRIANKLRIIPEQPNFLEIFDEEYDEKINLTYKKTFEYLNEIKKICDRNKIKLSIALAPPPFQFGKELIYEELNKNESIYSKKSRPLKLKKIVLDKPSKILENFCINKQIPCINLYKEIKKTKDPLSLYFKSIDHWNEKGERFVAKCLKNQIFL
ncbi:MAG: SGNH/GDSL hydrolase family protein [Minisyncoccales bacterium]